MAVPHADDLVVRLQHGDEAERSLKEFGERLFRSLDPEPLQPRPYQTWAIA